MGGNLAANTASIKQNMGDYLEHRNLGYLHACNRGVINNDNNANIIVYTSRNQTLDGVKLLGVAMMVRKQIRLRLFSPWERYNLA